MSERTERIDEHGEPRTRPGTAGREGDTSVVIVHRNPLEPFPYDRWLRDHEGPVVILAARDRFEPFGEPIPEGNLGYTHLELFDHDDEVAGRVARLAAEYGATHLIGEHEADVLRVAALREELGLPGARAADVLPFRDKALMKEHAARAGVEVAPHAVPRTAADVEAFADVHGFPLVVKNRAGFNSIGLRIMRDRDALTAFLTEAYGSRRDGRRDDLLLEAYVPGRMCHVDGLVVNGEVVLAWPSQYQYELASFGTDSGSRVDLALDPGDPLTGRLLELTGRTLAALRRPGGRLRDHAFHAEIFHTPDDRLVLCEIACRSGGGKIREVFHTLFGVNLAECSIRAQLGLPLPDVERAVRPGRRPEPARMAGQVLMMKRPGFIHALPDVPPEPWVEHFWLYARPGQVVPPASGSADFLTVAIASAPSRAECERRLRSLGARLEEQVRIGAVPS
ncbi:hypothetical protein [Microbispora bryophytorum]|uniref:ATP-grasp domain-containing protein n=1 Tax=Microbispora bryophytorum subsp. camponoti TaxID=1677852 RepID=A0ABR8L652_9ACTN|nr:hypothetical protein [Microbispora camponoti]MBD3145437.1 hypothetical protein [Microbispora camponoti]